MGKVIFSHPAWARLRSRLGERGKRDWPTRCSKKSDVGLGMADFGREPSQEYWRPASSAGKTFPSLTQARGNEALCECGTPYAIGARFCHFCGQSRAGNQQTRNPLKGWLDLNTIRTQFGLSTASMVLVLAAAIFVLATLMTGLVYNTSTLAEWQAVQTWRIEWLLATLAALVAAALFKTKT